MTRSAPQSAQRYPLTRILGVEANVRVLRELSRHGGQLSAPSLVERTGLARASVWAALSALEETGILSVAGTNRARLYSMHAHHRLRAPLNALFRAEERRFDEILDAIRRAASAFGDELAAVWLHGSVARGDDRPDSDMDIVIIAGATVSRPLLDSARDAAHAAGERLGFAPAVVGLAVADVAKLARERDPWWVELARDAFVLSGLRPEEMLHNIRLGSAKQAAA